MAAGWGYSLERHKRAWRWLEAQDPDVALLQEVIPPSWAQDHWPSLIFERTYPSKRWGSAIVSKRPLTAFQPSTATPWLGELWGSTVVGSPAAQGKYWFASIHSNAYRLKPEKIALYPTQGIRHCKSGGFWQVELVAHELQSVFAGKRFVAGGDLNSSLLFDAVNRYEYNAILFKNLEEMGFADLRTRFSPTEHRTFFRKGRRPYQLDHLFADRETAERASSWRVLPEPVGRRKLSDHAPVEVLLP